MPKRIQMTRRKPWRHLHPDAVIVARGHDWGNPYRVGEPVTIETPSVYRKGDIYGYGPVITPEIAVLLFRIWVSGRLEDQSAASWPARIWRAGVGWISCVTQTSCWRSPTPEEPPDERR